MASSRNLVLTIGAQASPTMGDGTPMKVMNQLDLLLVILVKKVMNQLELLLVILVKKVSKRYLYFLNMSVCI